MGTIIKGLQSVIIALGIIAVVGTGVVLYYNVVNPPSNRPTEEVLAEGESTEGEEGIDEAAPQEDGATEGDVQPAEGEQDSSEGEEAVAMADGEDLEYPKLTGPISHDHNYTKTISRLATCTEQGEAVYRCTICDDMYTEAIPMVPHTPGQFITVQTATAAQAGIRQKYCTVCGQALEEEDIPILTGAAADAAKPPHQHTYTYEVTKEPTCDAAGERTYTCVDGDSTFKTSIPARNHPSRGSQVTDGNCGSPGSVKVVCNICNAVISETQKLYPHTFSGWYDVVAATPTTQGRSERVCDVCGTVETRIIPKLTGEAAEYYMALNGSNAANNENGNNSGTTNNNNS